MRNLKLFWPRDGLFYLCAFVVVAAVLLGGGTRNGFLSDSILQLIAVPLLLAALWRCSNLPSLEPARWPIVFCAAVALVPLLQAIPLPPEIWTRLPNRTAEMEALELAGQGLPWMPISVAPQATMLSALSLVVPFSIFFATLVLDLRERRLLSLVVLAIALLSVFVGLSQVAQGPSSPLRLFDFTNNTEAVGFFANRNHFAALLYCATLIAAAWTASVAQDRGGTPLKRYDARTTVALIACFTTLVILVAAQLMARSRGGLALTIVALLGAFALAFVGRRAPSTVQTSRLFLAAVALALVFATQFALYRIMERFAADPLQDARLVFGRTTIEAAMDFMPFGSGMGTFVPVYALFEKPHDVLSNVFANRAHNDILELWLETGVAGLVLMAAFLWWFLARAMSVWRRPAPGISELDSGLARAATLVVALLVAHSFVDYPLRTGAMMAVFAFACALMTPPPITQSAAASGHAPVTPDGGPPQEGTAQGPVAAWRPPVPQPWPSQQGSTGSELPGASPPRLPGQRWGQDIEWPEEWRPRPRQSRTKTDDS